jgi:pyruvate kinase
MTVNPPPDHALSDPQLLDALRCLRRQVAQGASAWLTPWPAARNTAVANLAAYRALRRLDLRHVQDALIERGLCDLGRTRQAVLPTLDALVGHLALRCGDADGAPPTVPLATSSVDGLGPPPEPGLPHWMVTLPAEAADDPGFVDRLIAHGMSIARINCAHDEGSVWLRMINNVRAAAARRQRPVKVLFEFAGNKARTAEVRTARGHERINEYDSLLLARGAFLPLSDYPTQARVTLPEVLDGLGPGDPVWIDDGHAGGIVERVLDEGVVVRIERARAKGARIRPNKGLNFPATPIGGPPLRERDHQDLALLLEHADMVGYSFVQSAQDMSLLQRALHERLGERAADYPVIAKIETPRAVRALPEIIAAAAGRHPLAVMIARGDLGVELGFEKLADTQQTILDVCEAAAVPAIWATEVLGHFIKQGTHARGELTDAALGTLADCVMLNKGPFVCEALDCLQALARTSRAQSTRPGTRLCASDLWPLESEEA